MDLVSVIIPTFNRFEFLLNAIHSIQAQTYPNIEIIVVNDCSTEKEYYEYDWEKHNITILHLEKNSKKLFGFACAGYVRNKGIEKSSGKYIAFCDDDDSWFPYKIEKQVNAMNRTGCKMCSTDGLFGNGKYDSKKTYKKYNAEHYFNTLQTIYKHKGSTLLENGFPEIWNIDFVNIHNCIITSSAIVEKELLRKINGFQFIQNGKEDYDCWLRALTHTNNVYIPDICFYYDGGHGHGQQY